MIIFSPHVHFLRRVLFIIIILGTFLFALNAQTSAQHDAPKEVQKLVTKNMLFKDGIYHTFQVWQKNQPDTKMSDLTMNYFLNPINNLLEIDTIAGRKTHEKINPDSLWCVVLSGVTYVAVPKKEISKSLSTFAALTSTGNFCYFQYQIKETVRVPITAYAPQTGEPFMTKDVTRTQTVWRQKLMAFDSGEIYDFDVSTVKQLVADDDGLSASLNALKPTETVNKLFKCLMIYNDRHPVFLK